MSLTWTPRTSSEQNAWRDVAWAPSLSLFAAVSSDGTNRVMTSPDGVTWTARSAASADSWMAIAWSEDLGIFAAVGHNAAMSSPDGITWTTRTPATGDDWEHIHWSDALNMFIATSGEVASTDSVMTSTDGMSWTGQTTSAVSNPRGISSSTTLGLAVVVLGSGASQRVMTSTDGVSWTLRNTPVTYAWSEVAWSPVAEIFVAISGPGGYMTSTDGTTWTAQGELDGTLSDIVWSESGGVFVIICDDTWIHTSPDGLTWTSVEGSTDNNAFQGIADAPALDSVAGVSANGTNRVAIGLFSEEEEPPTIGWYRSEIPGLETGVDATQLVGASARPKAPRGNIFTNPFSEATTPLFGFPGHAVAFNNRMIYAGGDYTAGVDLPPIRVWNGTSDYQLAVVPKDGSGNIPKCITTIVNGDGKIYLGTWDTGTNSTNIAGRILRLDPNSGQLTNVGNVNSLTGYIPWALWFHNGELWAGLHRSDTSAGRIYRIKPEEQTAWTLDRDITTDSVGGCTVINAFQGKMYFGTTAASGTFAKFGNRDAAGTYALVYTGTGGTAQAHNGFNAACVFNDALYFSYWNPDATPVSLIKKYDGTTVSTAFTVTSVAEVPIIGLFVHDGVLYAIGSVRDGGDYTSVLLTTPDGTTWTNRTGDLPLGDYATKGVTNAFASIAY